MPRYLICNNQLQAFPTQVQPLNYYNMMLSTSVSRHIHLDEYSAMPKYLQISNSIISAMTTGQLNKGAVMPSLNDLSNELCVSRGTIEKCYRYLKAIKAMRSYPGKGYYIADINFSYQRKVCLLFNKLSAQKKIIYDSFIEFLGPDCTVTLFIYNNDFRQFETLLRANTGEYTHFVIIPHFIDHEKEAFQLINSMDKGRVILLDKLPSEIKNHQGAVYENFEKDIYRVLSQIKQRVNKYQRLNIIFPHNSYYPKEIIKGFTLYCKQHEIAYSIIGDLEHNPLKSGELYITLAEDDLVTLLDHLQESPFKIGNDIGIISYNETPIKKFLLNGITTISTDFKLLGNLAAELVLDDSKRIIEVPFYINLRPSI